MGDMVIGGNPCEECKFNKESCRKYKPQCLFRDDKKQQIVMKQEKDIEIPFGAFDSELGGWQYTIPEGCEAVVENGKVIVRKSESEDEKTKKEIINYLECQSRDEPSRKDTHNKWISYIEKYALSKDNYGFLRDCARVLKTFGWQSYADRLTGLCPASGEAAKAMMSTPIIFDESKDERIRQGLICFLTNLLDQGGMMADGWDCKECEEYIVWLEKQGEQKSDDVEEPNFFDDFRKTDFEIEPKFKVGDWVMYCGKPYQITGLRNDTFTLTSCDGSYFFNNVKSTYEPVFHLWTIQDAKDGDVLSYRDGQWIFIHKGIVTEDTFKYYALLSEKGITVNDAAFSLLTSCIIPATKEQRDQLEKAMADAGYTFDFEKKELNKIEQASAWSEEDENTRKKIIKFLKEQNYFDGKANEFKEPYKKEYEWLKSLKDRIQPRQEWSNEEKNRISRIIAIIRNSMSGTPDDISWLKSLRPQSQWKPSEEQMEYLAKAITTLGNEGDNKTSAILYELRTDLKKLKC